MWAQDLDENRFQNVIARGVSEKVSRKSLKLKTFPEGRKFHESLDAYYPNKYQLPKINK